MRASRILGALVPETSQRSWKGDEVPVDLGDDHRRIDGTGPIPNRPEPVAAMTVDHSALTAT